MSNLSNGICATTQVAEAEISVPKSIQDIVDLIKQAPTDNKLRDQDLKLLDKEISNNAKEEEQYIHYYLQARAAQRLGRINLRIELLNKSLEHAKPRTQQVLQTTAELVQAEMQVGNSKKAIARFEALIEKIPITYRGQLLNYECSLSEAYAGIGDFESAEKHLRECGGVLASLRDVRLYSLFGLGWTKNHFSAQAELAFQKGKFFEAETIFRKIGRAHV